MERNRKCILCETVHTSKQEMDEHMRSMLHHRELEKLRGRDCGHECRVCKVTVVSLTEYASHISSPTHKQKVEAAEQKNAGPGCNEDYFDQVLVDLIEKRKEQIRKEKEAAAAKLAKEEEERRRKEEFQQRLKEVKEQYRLDGAWQKPSYGFSRPGQQGPWYRGNPYNSREEEARPWLNNVQGKSATWHAQEPPNFQRWGPGDFAGGHMHSQEGWGNRRWDQGPCPGNQRSRLPWLSNGGSSNGIYGRNNISQMPQRGRHMSLVGPPLMFQSSPSFFGQPFNQFNQGGCCGEGSGGQGRGFQNGERPTAEHDHIINKNSKTLGSNPKLDKDCRWSPYPVTKGVESVSHKDTHQNALEKHSKVPTPHRKDNPSDNKAPKKTSQLEEKPGQPTSSGQCVEEKGRHTASPKTQPRDESSSGSRSSSMQREEPLNRSSSQKSLQQKDQKMSSALSANSATAMASSTSQLQPKSTSKQCGPSRQAPPSGSFQSKQERQLPEILKKAKQVVAEKRSSMESSKKQEVETAHQLGVYKENSRRQNATPHLPSTVRPEKPANKSSDSSQFLQSFQVSTSTMESSEPAAPNREEEENRKKELETTRASMQTAVMGQNSESETSRTGDTQQQASGLSKLDLPPVFKRDLTKHISSKSKAGGHEPNLNIARRVRNLSESRRSDSEKDSGLKPTVRQLISSSGSRRNVNWEQVYQEVRKKQDKGKGMPRFGIEMVPLDQEDQSQEEDDIPLLEGFHWDSLMEVSASTTSRKRSLSESSLAPGSTPSVFTSLTSPETPQREGLDREQQGSSVFGSKEVQQEPQLEKMLCEIEAKVETEADKRTVMELQRSDSLVDSGSGSDQYDGQGTGKRRRGVKDPPSAETSCSEHNNKRRKVKPKKERLQIDRLLAVSLREEELSRSLHTLDTSLIQARAALEAAYMEVQRLSVVKQQMMTEMNTLRNKRIGLLKGMQGSREELPQGKLKENNVILVKAEPHTPLSSSPVPSVAVSPNPVAERASPPSSSLPFGSITIKQEPQSPIHVNPEPDPVDQMTLCAHSTTPELQTAAAATAAAASSPGPVLHSQSFPALKPELHQTDQSWENFSESADCNESFPQPHGTVEKAVQATRNILTSLPDYRPSIKLSPSRRDSEVGSVGDCAAAQAFEAPVAPSLLSMPASPSELRSGKRVRKLKKRKLLKKALGAQQPESSDTELDGEAMRPRWLRPRRRSGGSQAGTSSPPSEDRDADVIMEGGNEPCRQPHPTVGHDTANQRSPKHMVELPLVAPVELTANPDSDEGMEVSEVCQRPPDTDTQLPVAHPAPESLGTKQESLGCNEVTSTSDMDICKSSESDAHSSILLAKIPKTSSGTLTITAADFIASEELNVSSDHGEDDLPTEGVFEGHQEAVNAMQIHDGLLYTCSGDRTVRAFDLVSHKCVGVFEGHTSKVSCLLVSVAPCLRHRLYSGSSDQTIRCYNLKTRELEQHFSLSDRVLCLHSRWKILFAGLANGTVVTFNLKTNKQMDVFECHGPRAVSCLASSQEGARWILLVGSFDSTISVRDAKSGLLLRTLEGHTKTVLCMKVVNDLVFSSSSDHCVYAHNIHTGELVRVYEGHSHAVTVVTVLGKVMVTACLDKLVRVYDLQSHDQLQVYGGHKDMVMCMAVYKNMIYTGCYDGSVEAVKLNLLQNFRCWWHGCSLVFGLMEHLQQHLADDHASANVQTALKCRWKNCEEFFCARTRSKQAMLLHLQKHAEEENQLEP